MLPLHPEIAFYVSRLIPKLSMTLWRASRLTVGMAFEKLLAERTQ